MAGAVTVEDSNGAISCPEVMWTLPGNDVAVFRASGYVLSDEFEAAGSTLQLGLYRTSGAALDNLPGGWADSGIFVFCGGADPTGYRISIQPGEARICKAHRFEGKSENFGFWAWALCRMPKAQELCIRVTLLQASDLVAVGDLDPFGVEAAVADVMAAVEESCASDAKFSGQVLRLTASSTASGLLIANAVPIPLNAELSALESGANMRLPQQAAHGKLATALSPTKPDARRECPPPMTPRPCGQQPRQNWQPALTISAENPVRRRASKPNSGSSGSSCSVSSSSSSSPDSWSSGSTSSGYESPAAGTGGSPGRSYAKPLSGTRVGQNLVRSGETGPDLRVPAGAQPILVDNQPAVMGCATSRGRERVAAALKALEQLSQRRPSGPALATCVPEERIQHSVRHGCPLSSRTLELMQVFDPVVNVYDRFGSVDVHRVIEIECLHVAADDIDWEETSTGLLVTIRKRQRFDETVSAPVGPLWQSHGTWAREFLLHDSQARFDICERECGLKDGILSISLRRPLQDRHGHNAHDDGPAALRPLRHQQRPLESSIGHVVRAHSGASLQQPSKASSVVPVPSMPQTFRAASSVCSNRNSNTLSLTSCPATCPGIAKLNLACGSLDGPRLKTTHSGDGSCLTSRGGA